jgi:HK97 family phage portal protein
VNIWGGILGWVGQTLIKAATQRDKTGWFVEWAQGGKGTVSGERVGNDSALQLSTVFDCIRCISEDVGKLPFKPYRSLEPQGKEVLAKHPLYRIFQYQANPEMTAITFRQTLTAHTLGWGNGFAEIQRNIEGKVVALWPLRPDRVSVMRMDDGLIWYKVRTDDGQFYWLHSDDTFHIPGLGFDGLVGYNVIRYGRECLGAAMAAQTYGAGFFGNSCSASGVLKIQGTLSTPAQERLRSQIEKMHRGAANAKRLMILEEGAEFVPTSIPPEEAQFLETRKFTVPEICRWFRMPPHMVADLEHAHFRNIEHQGINYVTYTLQPWFIRWEQEVWRKLLTERERRSGLFVKHLAEGLLRGDILTRYRAYQIGRNWGWYSADDVLELEDRNPLPNGQGKKYLIPLNMRDANEKPAAEILDKNTMGAVISDAADRIASAELREIKKVVGKAERDREKFNAWIESFFAQHAQYITKTLTPLVSDEGLVAAMTEQLCSEAVEAWTQGTIIDVSTAWSLERKENISTLIREGIDNASAETEER